jgi:hypothetical protein
MSDAHALRVGLNEALFRRVNEEIESLNTELGGGAQMTIVCECADGECTDRIEIGMAEYESIRSDARSFVVAPGHEIPDFETVIERNPAYEVVRKREGTAARVAEQTDPRS